MAVNWLRDLCIYPAPSVPIRALVLLFFKPPLDSELKYIINVLLFPKNVVLREVLLFRRKWSQHETYVETPPDCKLYPKQVYSLTTNPGGDSVKVQPLEAEFDEESYDNYVPTFQVIYETRMNDIEVFLKDSSSTSVWERRVCLNLRSKMKLLDKRSSFIDGMYGDKTGEDIKCYFLKVSFLRFLNSRADIFLLCQ